VLLVIRRGSDTRLVAVAEISGALAVVIFNLVIVRRVLHVRLDWRGAVTGALGLLKQTWFLGASDLAWAAMWYSPSVMIGWVDITHIDKVAWMAAAVRIVMALHTFVWLYFFNLIPNLSREIHEGLAGWRELLARSMSSSTWAACLLALVGTFFAPIIVETVYGAKYAPAVLPFQIAIWMIPVAWFSGHFRFSLIASGHQRLEFIASAVAGAVTVAGAYAGARLWGPPGAAVALLTGGVVNAVVAGFAMYRVIGSMRLVTAVPPVLSCLAAGLIGAIVTEISDHKMGAAAAILFYGIRAGSQWNVARLRLAWHGRLD
jgi:O-antigen/teichoic acid export membrane protein